MLLSRSIMAIILMAAFICPAHAYTIGKCTKSSDIYKCHFLVRLPKKDVQAGHNRNVDIVLVDAIKYSDHRGNIRNRSWNDALKQLSHTAYNIEHPVSPNFNKIHDAMTARAAAQDADFEKENKSYKFVWPEKVIEQKAQK